MKRILALAVMLGAFTAPVHSADILDACASDVSQYCSAVELGNGRLFSCLYAHEQSLSDACFAATADVGDILDSLFAGIRVIYEACGSDIAGMCGDIQPGDGRVLSCLAEHKSQLSQSCSPTIAELEPMLAEQ